MSKTFVNITFFIKNGGYSLSLYNPATNSVTKNGYTYPQYITIGVPVNGNTIDWDSLNKGKSQAIVKEGKNFKSYPVNWELFFNYAKNLMNNHNRRNIKQNNINIDINGRVGSGPYLNKNSFYITVNGDGNTNNVDGGKKLSYSTFGSMSSGNNCYFLIAIIIVVVLFFLMKKRRK
jgi:hypothetical protein